jgi:hypothetical protein
MTEVSCSVPYPFRQTPEGNITFEVGTTWVKNLRIAGFEVPTAVAMNNSTFWDITPHSLLKGNRHFEGICCLPLKG